MHSDRKGLCYAVLKSENAIFQDLGKAVFGKSTTIRYSTVSIIMHWVMLGLLIAVYSCIELRELFPKGSLPRETLKTWHFMLGLSVFLLVWLRLLVRLFNKPPRIEPPLPQWQVSFGKLIHILLYALLIVMPLLGWLALSAEGAAIPFFGLQLSPLIGEKEILAEWFEEIHETIGTAGYFLIGIHALAALFHHYIRRDNVLVRMLPLAKPR